MNLLETKQLAKHFGGLKALAQFDMQLQEGMIFGVIGPNGAGKTTSSTASRDSAPRPAEKSSSAASTSPARNRTG